MLSLQNSLALDGNTLERQKIFFYLINPYHIHTILPKMCEGVSGIFPPVIWKPEVEFTRHAYLFPLL